MRLARRQFLHLSGGALMLPAVADTAWAQTAWPTKPVHIISGFAAGGGVDITARLIGQWLSDRLGRKKLFTVTLGLYLVAAGLTAFSWDFASFALFRFLTGAAIGG